MLCFWNKDFWEWGNFIQAFKYGELSYGIHLLYIRLYKILIGLSGSIFFIVLFYQLFKNSPKNKFAYYICDWGKYTLGIYIAQTYILEAFLARYVNCDNINFFIFNFIVAPSISIAVYLVSVYIVKLISKWEVTNWLFLGQSIKSK